MTPAQTTIPLDDRRVAWVPWFQVRKAHRHGFRPSDVGHLGIEQPGRVPLSPAEARLVQCLSPIGFMPRARAAGVTLPAPLVLPSGAVDRARMALGKRGDWPVPEPGSFSEEDG